VDGGGGGGCNEGGFDTGRRRVVLALIPNVTDQASDNSCRCHAQRGTSTTAPPRGR
jgi:hypothetical protein